MTFNSEEPDTGSIAALAASGQLETQTNATQRHLFTSASPSERMLGRCLVFSHKSTPTEALEAGEQPREIILPQEPVAAEE
jgi:hypothetical protein